VNQNINEREKELVESYDFAPFMPKHRASKRGASSKMKDQPIESKKEEGGEGNPGGGMVNERTSSESSCQIRRNSVVAPLASLSLGWVVIYADRLSLSPLLNLIKGEFRLSYAAVSLVVSIYFLTYVSFTIPATIFAGRFGYKEGIVFFLSLAAISFGLAGIFGYSFYLLLFLIAIHGVGAGAYYPSAYTISSELAPSARRGFVSAIVNSGWDLEQFSDSWSPALFFHSFRVSRLFSSYFQSQLPLLPFCFL
jgi:MFS family permease